MNSLRAAVLWEGILALVILVLLLLAGVLIGIKDGRVRGALGLALVGSLGLVFAAFFLALCGLWNPGPNEAQCQSGTPGWPLVGIPILLMLGVLSRWWRSPLLWWVGGAVFCLAVILPWIVLSSSDI
jgi:hypothetical protein